MKYFIHCLLFSMIFFGCQGDPKQNKTEQVQNSYESLFTLLSPEETGVQFANMLEEKLTRNVGAYEYYYNGGGVAVGDVNNDGLVDLFFTGNLLPNKLYLNKGNLQFEEISKTAGLESNNWSTGAVMADVNNDGLLDIYVCNSGPFLEEEYRTNQLYINQGTSSNSGKITFTEEAAKYGIADNSKSTQASFFDYDNDNDLDLFVLNHSKFIHETSQSINDRISNLTPEEFRKQSCSLYRNDQGRFTDVTNNSGILKLAFGLGLVTSDLNHDGLVDIYVANDFFIPDFMFINNGDGTFTDQIKEKMGHTPYYSMGCDAADINNDGLVDLVNLDMTPEDHIRNKMLMASMDISEFRYLTGNKGYISQYMVNTMQVNNGFGIFSEIGMYAGIAKTDWSWAALLADFDNDGFKDYFITNGFKRDTKNNDWKSKVMAIRDKNNGEISNEAYWELLQETESNPIENYVFKNNGDFTFSNETKNWGFNQKSFSNGAAYADLDQDGDLELIVNNIDQPVAIYKNNASEAGNKYIRFEIKNDKNSSATMNAKFTIFNGNEKQYAEYTPVRGFQSSMENYIHFGLGDWKKIDKVEIKWLNGNTSIINNPTINQTHVVDFKKLPKQATAQPPLKPPFFDITNKQPEVTFKHQENKFDDFQKEILLPHMQSVLGPFIGVGDANGDQLEDFFVGGAKGQSGELYLQRSTGMFYKAPNQPWTNDRNSEDMGSLFFDADGDGDQDLYIASGGGGEFKINDPLLQDRLYLNDGKGNFSKAKNALPKMLISSGRITGSDYDKDGDIDLFVGGRTMPGKYPYPIDAFLLRNDGGKFSNITTDFAPEFNSLGMVTDAIWTDYDGDNDQDLIVVGEWMPISIFENNDGKLKNVSQKYNLAQSNGWWYSIASADFDNDGDQDYVIGNIGKNNKFHPKSQKPLHVFCNDFDDNGSLDIVLSKSYKNNLVPIRGKECSTQQMPDLAEKFPSYKSFSESTLNDIYGDDKLDASLHYESENFASILLENTGNGFEIKKLPAPAQFAPINAIIAEDFDNDGNIDMVISGNYYKTEAETPRYDAGKGLFLKGNGNGTFNTSIKIADNGLFIPGDAKDAKLIHLGARRVPLILVSNNDSKLQMFMKVTSK